MSRHRKMCDKAATTQLIFSVFVSIILFYFRFAAENVNFLITKCLPAHQHTKFLPCHPLINYLAAAVELPKNKNLCAWFIYEYMMIIFCGSNKSSHFCYRKRFTTSNEFIDHHLHTRAFLLLLSKVKSDNLCKSNK